MTREKWKIFWNRFLHWPGWTAWLQWKGWTAWLHWSGWGRIARWPGWRKLFAIHPAPLLLLTGAAAAGLGWVFLTGHDSHWMAYPVYVLSAYTLTALCFGIPGLAGGFRRFVKNNAIANRVVSDDALRFTASLYFEQVVNAFYGILKTVSGAIQGSAWIGADGLYNLAQAAIQLVQILRRKKNLTLKQQWQSYRLCGWLVLILQLTITGLVFQMIRMGRTEEYPGYLIFVTALFTFYKLIHSFVDVAKDRKNKAPIDSSVRLLDLAQALFSLFSLQTAMIHQFGGSREFADLMNNLTGGAVCLLVVGMGIYMLRRSRREMRKLEERENE